mgnify:CR=1 FL=1
MARTPAKKTRREPHTKDADKISRIAKTPEKISIEAQQSTHQPSIAPVLDKMPKRKVAALEKVEADLVNLQYKIRRDPKCDASVFLHTRILLLTKGPDPMPKSSTTNG